jgi:hypothetical protein
MMNDQEKSDRFVVSTNPPNETAEPVAEVGERRERPKGNSPECNASRTQSRTNAPSALERVRQAAKRDRKQRFTALLHHVYDPTRLRAAYDALKRNAAAGVDGETWRHYGERLEENLQDLAARLKRGAYRAHPVRRAYIPKTDGGNGRSAFPRWKTRSSSVPSSRCLTRSTNRTSSASRTGFVHGAVPMMHWTRCRSA